MVITAAIIMIVVIKKSAKGEFVLINDGKGGE